MWEDGVGMQDLNDLVDPTSGWLFTRAVALNNKGQIVVEGSYNGEWDHSFLLTPIAPVPLPAVA